MAYSNISTVFHKFSEIADQLFASAFAMVLISGLIMLVFYMMASEFLLRKNNVS